MPALISIICEARTVTTMEASGKLHLDWQRHWSAGERPIVRGVSGLAVFLSSLDILALSTVTHTHTDESSPVGFINLQLACAWSHVVHNATCSCVNCVVCHTHPGDTQRLWLAGAEWELQPRRMTTKGKGGRRGGGVRRRQMNSSSLGSTLYWQQRSRWEMESTCGAGDGEAWGGPLAADVRGGHVTC